MIYLCGNFTLDFLSDRLRNTLDNDMEVTAGGFNQFRFELRQGDPKVANSNFILLCLDWRKLVPSLYCYSAGDDCTSVLEEFESCCVDIRDSIDAALAHDSSAVFLVFTPIWDSHTPFGFIDRRLDPGMCWLTAKADAIFNKTILSGKNVYPVDVNALSARAGKDNIYDNRMDVLAKSPFTDSFHSLISKEIAGIIDQIVRSPLKCIVLDCDNTLWGGIVGEDGIHSINLGDEGIGSAFKQFQSELLRYSKQGVFLAIASKNNEEDVFQVLEEHPHMVLKKEVFAAWEINWESKSESMKRIAQKLNIGLDSMLFIDDNPIEREQVKSIVPQVNILNLPSDPVHYTTALKNCSRLFPLNITSDDLTKVAFWKQNSVRKEQEQSSGNLNDFLMQSGIVVEVSAADASVLPRIAQLFSKTNQFNLTTKRHTEADLEKFASHSSNWLGYISLSDKYGDYGIVGAALVLDSLIDSFLISCRAFGREIEQYLLARAVEQIMKNGHSDLRGLYTPTIKNRMVESFYPSNGFIFDKKDGESTVWTFNAENDIIRVPEWISTKEKDNG